jgi:hypothetical protein
MMRAEKRHDLHVPTDVYLSFVSSLFDNRATLFTGMVVHILTCVVVYIQTGAAFYLFLCGCFASVFAYRIYSFKQFDQVDKPSLTREGIANWEMRYVLGGALTAALLGIGSGYAMLSFEDTFAELACIAVTLGSMVSVVGRNYGSRLAVDLQTLACCTPMISARLESPCVNWASCVCKRLGIEPSTKVWRTP